MSGDAEIGTVEYVRNFARSLVRGGYDTREDIIAFVATMAEEDKLGIDAREMVHSEIAALKREQATWPAVTDYDRLETAMSALEDRGIVARQNFTCCMTCGSSEIGDEIDSYNATGRRARGYVFFHMQATEHAVEGGGINFAYGSADRNASSDDDVAIGAELADSIRRAGLQVDWNGKIEMCVMVGLDWKRRWTGD
jgi:hypothetical protein